MNPQKEEKPLVQSFDTMTNAPFFTRNVIILLVIVGLIGIGSGYVLSRQGTDALSVNQTGKDAKKGSISKGTIVGSDDLKTFKDATEGQLKKGGKDGEGQFHLTRPGGEDQTVYLTSSIVDLSQFVGRKVKVNGETQASLKVGWLMDVGRLEILE